MVASAGVEPARLAAKAPEASVSAIPPRGYGPRFQTSTGDLLFRREPLYATELSGEDVLDAGRRVELRVSGL